MTILTLRLKSALFLLSAASLWLASSGALASVLPCGDGLVCYYVAVQPIDVCSSTATGCAPFNTVNRVGIPTTVSSTNPIGFVDSSTGKDITRAILNQSGIGVDIAWSPMRQYNNTSSQSIAVDSCTATSCSSTAFQTLTDQPGISAGSAPTPSPPLNSSPTVLNMFFINNLVPPSTTPGTLYGYAWLGNNGIAISSNTFFPGCLGCLPRYDTLAHELGHNLGLNHADSYNYGGTAPTKDLLTQGSTRTEPTSTSNALTQLAPGSGAGTADQLEIVSSTGAVPPYQQTDIDLSGFLNPIASSGTTTKKTAPTTAAAVSVTTNSTSTATNNNTPFLFTTTGPTLGTGRLSETLIGLTLTIGPSLDFEKKYKVDFFRNASVTKTSYDNGKAGDPDCPLAGTQCLIIKLTNPGLMTGQSIEFTQGILSDVTKAEATLCQLAAGPATIAYSFSDGLVITSQLTGCGDTQLTANSQMPVNNANIAPPTQIDPVVFTRYAAAGPPCSLGTETSTVRLSNGCPDPMLVGSADGDPRTEGGQGGTPAVRSCTPTSSLSALLGTAAVTSYVPNGAWANATTGVRVVPIEPTGGVPAPIATPNAVNSCASNSQTGQTVCTANNTDVYLLSGTALTNVLTSGASGTAVFSGGACMNCGVAINQVTNKAVIGMGLSTGTGIQFLDLGTNAFSPPVPAFNQISEDLLWDPGRNLILSPNEGGVYDLFDTSTPSVTLEFANTTGGELDSAAEDCTTGIALAADEFTNKVYIADLTQKTSTPGTPGSWAAPQQFMSFSEFGTFSAGTSGLAVAPGSHLAVVTGEFGGNQFGILQLPATSGSGTPNFVDYVAASLPNTPDAAVWSEGLDPHTVTAYVSPNNGKAYALMANSPPPKWIAVVDMAALLAAPRVTTVNGTHNVDQAGLSGCSSCIDLVGTGIVRYVATGN